MKKVLFTATSIFALAFGSAMAAEDFAASVAAESNCKSVALLVKSAVEKAGGVKVTTSALATLVGEAIQAKPSCSCEIVTAAIQASGASAGDGRTKVESIVEAAFKMSPEQTATIAECATAAAPNHSASIEKVLTNVFSSQDLSQLGDGRSKNNRRGKGGKGVETKPDDGVDYHPIAAIPAPVYLIAPSGGIVGAGDFLDVGISQVDPKVQ